MLFIMDFKSFNVGDLVEIKDSYHRESASESMCRGVIIRLATKSDQRHFPFETFKVGWPIVHDGMYEYPYHPSMLVLISSVRDRRE